MIATTLMDVVFPLSSGTCSAALIAFTAATAAVFDAAIAYVSTIGTESVVSPELRVPLGKTEASPFFEEPSPPDDVHGAAFNIPGLRAGYVCLLVVVAWDLDQMLTPLGVSLLPFPPEGERGGSS